MATLPETMTVPHFVGDGRIDKIVKPVPQPGPGQLLIQVQANALCGSERGQFYHGSNVTPGHEAVGTVVAVGPSTKTPIGTQGAIFLMDFCGECRNCKAGYTNQCLAKRADMGFSHDGGYGVYELIHENIFFPTEGLTPSEITILLDVMGTGGHSIKRAQRNHEDIRSILIPGAGPIGLGILAMAKIMLGKDVRVLLSDVIPYRLKLAEKLGGLPILSTEMALADGLKHHGIDQLDVVIDAAGIEPVRQESWSLLAQRGVYVSVAHGGGFHMDSISGGLISREKTLTGSEYFAFGEFEQNYRLFKENRDYLNSVITHRMGVSEIQQAFELFWKGETGKVIIEQ